MVQHSEVRPSVPAKAGLVEAAQEGFQQEFAGVQKLLLNKAQNLIDRIRQRLAVDKHQETIAHSYSMQAEHLE